MEAPTRHCGTALAMSWAGVPASAAMGWGGRLTVSIFFIREPLLREPLLCKGLATDWINRVTSNANCTFLIRTMDYTFVIGIVVVLVVGFFAYQWISKRPVMAAGIRRRAPLPMPPPEAPAAPVSKQQDQGQVSDDKYPEIAGQTRQESLTKEPLQRRQPSSQQEPAMHDGSSPAQFAEHLRHPEQVFHQSTPSTNPAMVVTEVNAGRAGHQSAPMGGNQQQFSPEMAQNGGALLGASVFAYDGMEPTGFTAF